MSESLVYNGGVTLAEEHFAENSAEENLKENLAEEFVTVLIMSESLVCKVVENLAEAISQRCIGNRKSENFCSNGDCQIYDPGGGGDISTGSVRCKIYDPGGGAKISTGGFGFKIYDPGGRTEMFGQFFNFEVYDPGGGAEISTGGVKVFDPGGFIRDDNAEEK
jgi:hypothetical protein